MLSHSNVYKNSIEMWHCRREREEEEEEEEEKIEREREREKKEREGERERGERFCTSLFSCHISIPCKYDIICFIKCHDSPIFSHIVYIVLVWNQIY